MYNVFDNMPVKTKSSYRYLLSVYVRSRKMANYFWTDRSHWKLWWKFLGVLTCKSILWSGY